MSNQIDITGGARVRNLNGVITGSTGVLSSLPINGANGIPQLDASGKILVSQLPNSVMEFLGTWNAATNTPTLANGTGNAGDVYLCTVAGTVDFGAGPITFQDGDYVVYSGSTWERSSGAMGTVSSVGASITGNSIGITGSPVTTAGTLAFAFAGTSGQYINGAGNLVTFPSLTGYVPYTGATGNVNLGEWGITSGYYGFDLTPTGTPTTQGTMYWDASRQTVALIMDGTTQKIGQDSFFYVKNSSGSTIPKGTGVRFAGTDGASGHILIAPFLANGTYPSIYFMGITAEAIPNGSFGQVVNFGEIEGFDTSGFSAGDLLYASTTVAGGFQTTIPSAPNNIVLVAATLNSKSNGDIVVRPTYGSNINNDEGVLITSVANNQGLFYDSASGLWKNKSIATALGYTPISLTSLSATSPLIYNNATGNFSIQAANTSQSGYLTATDWNRFDIAYTNRITSANSPLSITSNAISISQATTSTNGYLSSTDWNTFNGKQNALTLTTTGSSGASTLVGATLNIPTYTLSGLGGVPTSRTLTINGTAYDLSADRTWTINSMVYPSAGIAVSTGTAWGTSIVDNSSNWNTAYSLRISSATAPLSISSNVISISQASSTTNGYLSSTDWNTFNNKQSALTNPVTGTGTTNYLPKFTGTSTIGNSLVYDNGTNVTIGGTSVNGKFTIISHQSSWNNYANTQLRLASLTSGDAISMLFTDGNNSNGWFGYQDNATAANRYFYWSANDGASQQMTLNSSGNLGLGVTPSAWATLVGLDIVEGGGAISSNLGGLYLTENAYFNAGWKYKSSSSILAALYSQVFGVHAWYTAPSGTAGNPITFTQAMTLTSGGNLLVGTTTDAGYKLDVNGTGRFSGNVAIGNISIDAWSTFNVLQFNGKVAVGQTGFSKNIYFNGTDYVYSSSGYASLYQQTSGGGHTFLVAPSGTAGGVVSLTTALSLAYTGAATFSSSVTATQMAIGTTTFNGALSVIGNAATNGLTIKSAGNGGTFPFRVTWSGGTDGSMFCINDNGNVGIGTTSPTNVLHINRDGASNYSVIQASNANSTAIFYAGVGGSTVPNGSLRNNAYIWNSAASSDMVIGTNDTERMRITSGGVMQIANSSGTLGTLVGSERLNVNGGIYAYGDITSGGTITFANNVINYGGNTNYKGATGSGDVTLSNNGSALLVTGPLQKNYGSSIKFVGNGSSSYDVDFLNAGFTTKTVRVLGSVHLETTDSSFVIPRMTTTQRDALNANNKIAGAMIYNTSVGHFQGYNGSGWTNFW